jgi:2-iminobutanoate/2-iminopropanoate deaminase
MMGIERLSTPWSYSQAVAAGDFVFLALHRGSGEDFAAQFDAALGGLGETLATFRLTLADLVKVHVWLKDIQDLREMEKLFAEYFATDTFPARMTATTEFIDADCLVMIEGTAYRGSRTL